VASFLGHSVVRDLDCVSSAEVDACIIVVASK